jgi:hypothetical protein
MAKHKPSIKAKTAPRSFNVYRPSPHNTFTAPMGSTFSIAAGGVLLINDSSGVTTHAFAIGEWSTVNVPP